MGQTATIRCNKHTATVVVRYMDELNTVLEGIAEANVFVARASFSSYLLLDAREALIATPERYYSSSVFVR